MGAPAARPLYAQGVTTGAVRGTVTDQAGQAIVGATVQLVNAASGLRFQVATSDGGRFFLPNVIVGTYTAESRAIGYRPQRKPLTVQLGQVADLSFSLEASTVELTAIEVAGAADPLLNRTRTGTTASVSETMIRNLPSLQRDFNDFTRTSALVNGNSIAGSADRFNSLQIDGGTNADLFGLNSSRGSPGGGNGSRPMSVEAIQEFQVLIAPFDVRQGGFTGGLVNAVTRSGTNQLHGSVFGFMQNEQLQGRDTAGLRAAQFDRRFYGFSLGGPIVRDRFHFFVAAEWRAQETPFTTRNISESDTNNLGWTRNVGLSARTAQRLRDYAINTLGFDPGDWRQPIIPNPDRNIFVKFSGQLGARSQIELAFNNVRSSEYRQVHDPFGANIGRIREGYQFNASGYDNSNENRSIRGRLNTQLSSRLTNELIVSAYTVQDLRKMANRVPLIIIGADSAGAHFAMGGERFSHLNTLDQDVLEIANNITYTTGRHVLTVGARAERFGFVNGFFPASLGAWYFPDTTRFMNPNLCRGIAGNPGTGGCRYERALPGVFVDSVNGRTDGPIADFVFTGYGLYAQDQITAARGLTITMGLRLDMTRLPKPSYNPLLDSLTLVGGPRAGEAFAVRTDQRPTDAVLWSPRFGFNYDVRGDQSLFVRGGAGVFSGRTPYVWASNAYTNTGLEQVQLQCTSNTGVAADTFPKLPGFSIDPNAQATACPNSAGSAAPRPAIVYFDKNFRLPQNLRVSLGVDRRLPWNMVGTIDLLYTRAINQFALTDDNLIEGGTSIGEGNRRLYGVFTGTNTLTVCRAAGAPTNTFCNGTANPAVPGRPAPNVLPNDVLRQYNTNEDYSYTASASLTKRFSDNLEFLASYAYSRSYDLMSPTSDISNSLLNFSTLDGTLAKRNLRPSFFDTPHSLRLSGTTTLPYGVRFSLFYTGSSGRPYAYRYNSDVNGDNFSGNDLFYVPLGSDDIRLCRGGAAGCAIAGAGGAATVDTAQASQYALLNTFIEGEKCLREQRGRIMERNSCRNPWRSFVDARVAKSFSMRGHSLELTANMFNVLSFLGVGGEIRQTSGNENIPMLTRAGYNAAAGRGVYTLLLPARKQISVFESRWKLELGGRYAF